ncbi:ABC-type transport system involved in Fe-S cluster assembly [Commensalibacter communis]|uniref:Permease and ATPase components (ATM1) n=1 Tax=Commensalibacter communis TaxID=2972786 RepID=A0A9W4XH96_9PROT|nr:ABC transporter ATP-binding protein/permease [Commensalibacter communis]CAI3929715.1 ABC-type transport system involved in Fe-S cluster assembly [Commensalibacter communis]CAI3930307.1 ABC-type transport system involved in Fe-S cluster assembly [Commensalibacter communis]CAI3931179.1 ABC-type transport system involved in Fe-S cluster assembly [Commensalibacter communis]CAI3932709.1 ABC-type transport system involved in Fe-S cluster assembly [Commensalibacter communis]
MSRYSKFHFSAKDSNRSGWSTLLELLSYLWPKHQPMMRLQLVGATLLMIIAKVSALGIPYLYSKVVDILSKTHGQDLVYIPIWLILGYGLIRIISSLCSELKDTVFAPLRFRVMRTITLRCFEHMHNLSLKFHLNRHTGAITRAIERGSEGVETILRVGVFSIVPTLIEALMVIIVIANLYDWRYTVLVCVAVLAYFLFTIWFTSWRIQIRRQMNEINNEANNRALDSLLNYETVKYFGNEAHEIKRYDESLERYEKASITTQMTLNGLNFGQSLIIAVALTSVMLLAAHDIVMGYFSVGKFVLINTYLMQLYQPLNFLGSVYSNLRKSIVDLENMFSLLSQDPEVDNHKDTKHLPANLSEAGPAKIEFQDVYFGYDIEREILHGVSFAAEPGSQVAIVGPTGAGKSTISRLLFRFYDVNSGSVKIDGQDIRDYIQSNLRAAIGVVPQDTVLFNDTIEYNIAYGRLGCSKEEIEHAAKLAQIHDFIQSLPDGYQTYVGERGLKLSGGEKQRIAIARAILKNPRILILDEATSALDSRTEQEIQQALDRVAKGRTVVTIAHRLSTIVHSDLILVMIDGKVREQGTHEFLLAKNGFYASMWAIQAKQSDE